MGPKKKGARSTTEGEPLNASSTKKNSTELTSMPKYGGYQAINTTADVEASTGVHLEQDGHTVVRRGSNHFLLSEVDRSGHFSRERVSHYLQIPVWSFHHEKLVLALCAVAMLLYGGAFARSMLLYQTIKVTAGDTMTKGCIALYNQFVSARAGLEGQAHSVDAKATLKQFTENVKASTAQIKEVQGKFKRKEVTKSDMEVRVAKAKDDIAKIMKKKEKFVASVSPVKAIMYAIDVPELKRVVIGMYAACMGVIATFSSPTASQVTLGLSLGHQIHHYAVALTFPTYESFAKEPMQPTDEKWTDTVLLTLSLGAGVWVASKLADMTIIFATCSVFAMTLVYIIRDWVNPFLNKTFNCKLEPSTKVFVFLHLILAGCGTATQILGLVELPTTGPIDYLLTPLIMLEQYLVGLSAGK